MPLIAVFTGASFRTALCALAVFVLVLAATGAMLYERLGTTMYTELEEQIVEEIVLFRDIYERGGQAALVRAIADTARPIVAEPRLTALFAITGERLAGTLDVAPDFVGWQSRTLARTSGEPSIDYRARAERWTDTTLVVGRDTRVIRAALHALIVYLVLAGTLVSGTTLVLGYRVSRRTRDRLARMAVVLERVGRGELGARMPTGNGSGQIERISRQMNEHLDALAALTEDTRSTIRNLAHDLRTPLNRASVRLQEAAAAVDGQGNALVEAAIDELDRLAGTFETILRIGRLRVADGGQSFTTFSLAELMLEMGEIYDPAAEAAGQRLVADATPDDATLVRADRRMIAQLIANLVENAVRHCPAGTRIALGTRIDPGKNVALVVADDGPGVPEAAREAVLRPFVRLDASRTLEGSGLGLALAAAVARHHGVELRLEDNEPGLRAVVAFPPASTERVPERAFGERRAPEAPPRAMARQHLG